METRNRSRYRKVGSFKILFNTIYIYTACTETVHNFRKIVSIHNLYQHLLDLCQCNALNEKWLLPDYLLLSNLLLLSSSYPKFSKKSKKKNFPSLFAMKTLANSKNNGDENSSEGKHDSYFIEIFYVHDICEPR